MGEVNLSLSQLQDVFLLYCRSRHAALGSLSDSAVGVHSRADPHDRMFRGDWLNFVRALGIEERIAEFTFMRSLTRALPLPPSLPCFLAPA